MRRRWTGRRFRVFYAFQTIWSLFVPKVKIGLFRDEDPTHVDKLKFYEFSGSVLGVNRVVDIDRIM